MPPKERIALRVLYGERTWPAPASSLGLERFDFRLKGEAEQLGE
jgi:hypothetical protein